MECGLYVGLCTICRYLDFFFTFFSASCNLLQLFLPAVNITDMARPLTVQVTMSSVRHHCCPASKRMLTMSPNKTNSLVRLKHPYETLRRRLLPLTIIANQTALKMQACSTTLARKCSGILQFSMPASPVYTDGVLTPH